MFKMRIEVRYPRRTKSIIDFVYELNKRIHRFWAVFVVVDVIVYFLLSFFLLFSCYWRRPVSTFTLPYLISSYLSLPYILPYLTLPYHISYLTFGLALPYVLTYLTLPYILPYLILPLTSRFALPYLTLSYILPYLTSYLSCYITLAPYLTLPYLVP